MSSRLVWQALQAALTKNEELYKGRPIRQVYVLGTSGYELRVFEISMHPVRGRVSMVCCICRMCLMEFYASRVVGAVKKNGEFHKLASASK